MIKMGVKEEIGAQITGALAGADFPIETPEKLISAFPEGAETTCKSGSLEITAGEAGKLLKTDDFPFESAESVADIIMERAGL